MSSFVPLALAIGQAATQNVAPLLTLDEAVRIAEQNAFAVRLANTNVEKQRQRLAEARANQGPRLVTSASYTRFDKEVSASDGSGGSFIVQPIDQKQAGATLSMPFDISGTIGRGIRGASAIVRSAAATANAERNTARLNARSAYFNVLRAQELVDVAHQNRESAEAQFRNAQLQEQAGVLAQVDVLRFQTQAAQARSDQIAALNSLAIAKQALNNALARPIQTDFQVQAPSIPRVAPADEAALTGLAIQTRPELRAIKEQREALALVRKAQESGLLPSLSLSASYSRNIDPPPTQRDYSASGTLALSWPVFDSGATRARVRQARQDEEAARVQQEQIELGVSLEVRQALSNLTNAIARVSVAQEGVRHAAETYRLAQVRLGAGEGTSLEVTQAQTDLVRAQTGLANARFDVLSAYAQLQRAVGTDEFTTATLPIERE